ncbi:MAG: hypothetical protein PHQ97_15120 [Desulfobacterales bacterium]|nr:hypothetical protein [Desulfobacterales bacterium]
MAAYLILKNQKKIRCESNIFAITFRPDAKRQSVIIVNGKQDHEIYVGDPEKARKIYFDICAKIEAKTDIDLTELKRS